MVASYICNSLQTPQKNATLVKGLGDSEKASSEPEEKAGTTQKRPRAEEATDEVCGSTC